jgi:prephenate dehydrogenase
VIGCGLIGTSVALALREHEVDVHLRDTDPEHLAAAVGLGAGAADSIEAPTLVVVAVPPSAVPDTVRDTLVEFPRAIVTDVAGVKLPVFAGLAGADGVERFVGGHPMAGSEASGPTAGSARIFEGRSWVVVPGQESRSDAVQRVTHLAETVGAVPVFLDAAAHDDAVALVSHVPHVMSGLVAGLLNGAPRAHLDLAGPGLRDVTRIAGSATDLWLDILGHNASAVRGRLLSLRETLDRVIGALGDDVVVPQLADVLDAGRAGTRRLPGKHGDVGAETVSVVVPIADRPGELSRLFADTGQSGVNVEDLRIDHERGRPVGLVEIAVVADGADVLVDALTARGWPAYR